MIQLKRGTSIEGVTLKDGQPIAILSDNNSASLYIGNQSGTPVKVSSDSSLSSIYTDVGIDPNPGTFYMGNPQSDIVLDGSTITINPDTVLKLQSIDGQITMDAPHVALNSNDQLLLTSANGINIEGPRLDLPKYSYVDGNPIVTSSSILNTGLKLIGIGTIYKHGTPYYDDPPEGTYIQTDGSTTFNNQAFLYDEDQPRYSQQHSYTSFVGYDHLVWDTSINLYKLDTGSLNYTIREVKITVFMSGKIFPDSIGTSTASAMGGFWYTPYHAPNGVVPTSWVDVGEPQSKTYLDVVYIPDEEGIYFGSTYSVVHKINGSAISNDPYYPNIGFGTYNNSKFVPSMGGTFCKMVIELYASQSGLIQ